MKNEAQNNKNIKLLGASSMLNDIGAEMITPILPLYITALGGGGIAVGLLSGLREGLASIFKILGGWISDRIGKRMPFVFLGYALSVIFRFLLAFGLSWRYIVTFVSLERLGKSRDAPRDAIIALSTKKRGRGFGLHQMFDSAGAVIGTIIVIFLFWYFELSFKSIILAAAFISAFSILPLFFVKEPKTKAIKKNLFAGISKLSPRLKYFIFIASVFTMANFGLYMFMILMAKQLTNSIIAALVLYAIFNLVFAVFTIPFGKLSDKIGKKPVLLAGYALLFILAVGFIYFSNLFSLVIFFILYGLVMAITNSNQRALVADLSDSAKGTALGFYHSVTGLVNIPAGIIAGFFWNISPLSMFAYIAFVSLISLVLLLTLKAE